MKKMTDKFPVYGVIPDVACHFYSKTRWQGTSVRLPHEVPLKVYVNQQELLTIMCTPTRLDCLVVGFLYSEGIITDLSQVVDIDIGDDLTTATVRLTDTGYRVPTTRTRTPTGISFATRLPDPEIDSALVVTPREILALMRKLRRQQTMFPETGGTHCSALASRKQIMIAAEDIGRHNTFDKLLGECMLRGVPVRDHILLTTGRISSEMLLKAAKIQAPIVVTKAAVTERAVRLAREFNITIVGYARTSRLSVFSGETRIDGIGNR